MKNDVKSPESAEAASTSTPPVAAAISVTPADSAGSVKLSKTQTEAVLHPAREICVSAAAGSGKTRVLVERFARAVLERGIAPDRIVAITYTQKAADELRERIERRLAAAGRHLNGGREPAIGTIHGFCLRLLQENAIEAGLDPSFRVLQGDLYEGILEEAIEEVLDESMRAEPVRFGPILEYASTEALKKSLLQGYERVRTLGRSPAPSPAPVPGELKQSVRRWAEALSAWQKRLPAEQASKLEASPDTAVGTSVDAFVGPSLDWEELLAGLIEMEAPLKSIGRTKAYREEAEDFLSEAAILQAKAADAVAAPYNALFAELLRRLIRTVDRRKRIGAWVDLHDLMDRVIELLERPAFGARIRADYAILLVDEYQDVNALQARLLDRLGSELEVFVVGDARQSIYGFRHAESSFFIERFERARQNRAAVEIPENYRSRPEIVGWINRVFAQASHGGAEFGNLESRRSARPSPATGSAGPVDAANPAGIPGPAVEMLWSVPAAGAKPRAEDQRKSDAMHAADAVARTIRGGSAGYGDIAVLLSRMTALGAYEDAFRRAEIPYHVIRGRGFYEKSEIVDLVNLFRAVQNPEEPLYLAALLRSPFAGLDDEAIWKIFKTGSKGKKTPEPRIALALQDPELGSAHAALERFWGWFAPLVTLRKELTLQQILERALDSSAFEAITLAQPDGLRRFANTRKFKDTLREFEGLYGANLEAFVVRLEERINGQTEERETEAAVASEKGGAVRILTVHASKGLEFPVVIAADLSNTAPKRRQAGVFMVDDEARVVSNPPNVAEEDGRIKSGSFERFQERSFEKESEESLRQFYVAATRAKEKLILCGSLDEKAGKKDEAAKSWTDWVLGVFPEAAELTGDVTAGGVVFGVRRRMISDAAVTAVGSIGPAAPNAEEESTAVTVEQILENLKDRSRPYRQTTDLTVTALAQAMSESDRSSAATEEDPGEVPAGERNDALAEHSDLDAEETLLGASSVGHLFHEMLQHVVFEREPAEEEARLLRDFAYRMDAAARPDFENALKLFLTSRLAEDLRASERAGRPIYRELPFFYRVRGEEGRELGSVKGQVDLLFEAPDGKWTLVDYKTTRHEKPEHHHQLRLYAFCLKKLLAGRPHKALLYYSRPGALTPVDLSALGDASYEEDLKRVFQDLAARLTAI